MENNKKFDSSMIKEAWYSSKEQELTVLFPVGKKYLYFSVDENTWDEMCTSESAGQYFSKNIKGKHRYKIITS